MSGEQSFDCVIVGAGILGLAHALVAARNGMKVAVIDRDAAAVGASIRNFGFVTVTGQQAGITWRRARRSRDVWAGIAPAAGIEVLHRGLLVCARRPEALAVLAEFAASPMGAGCRLVDSQGMTEFGAAVGRGLVGGLHSPHELRVESREAIPRLAAFLAETHGVTVLRQTAVVGVSSGSVDTTAGRFRGTHVVVCPGGDLTSLYRDIMRRRGLSLCKLHMLRVADPGWRLPGAIMSDLGLVRYLGYAVAPSLPALRERLEAEQGAWLADGIHLIVVQSADGSLVVGDSHHYDQTPDPFQPRAVDDRILAELSAVLDIPAPDVTERWTGVYPVGSDTAFTEATEPGVRLVLVTSGTGASTAFAIAEETMADLLGLPAPPHADPAYAP